MKANPLKQKKIMLGVFIALLGLGLWLFSSPKPPVMPFPGVTILPKPLLLSEFQLTDHKGKPFTNQDLKGNWSFIFFGYSHCPDICPTTLALLNSFYKKLGTSDKHTLEDKRVIFITSDPIRDTVDVMADHVEYFNPDFIGLTANDIETLKTLGEEIGVIFDYEETETHELITDYSLLTPDADYSVEHNASIFIIDPKGRLVADILPPHTLDRVSETFNLVDKYY